jgi:hypothetical protein
MKFAVLLLCGMLATGCSLRKQRPVATAAPPAPKPQPAAAATPVDVEPLSIPQTEVRLPEPQPIPAEALATAELPVPPQVEVPMSKPGRVASGPAPPPLPRVEPEPPGPEAPGPRIQTLIPESDRRRFNLAIDGRRREIQQILSKLEASSPNTEQREAMARVSSLVSLADQAAERGDLRQADALSARALSLARGLVQ